MFTQFLGNYLLNENIITSAQLIDALEAKKNTRLKLGMLAINAGYMNAEQVELVHEVQTVQDKRFGDIAIEKGYLTNEQLQNLLNSQATGYLLLGQALVDNGALTNEGFADVLYAFKEKYQLSDSDLKDIQEDKLQKLVYAYFSNKEKENAIYYIDFTILLFKNLIRFIGDDFLMLNPSEQLPENVSEQYIAFASQKVTGDTFDSNVTIAFDNPDVLSQFACRYAQEDDLGSDEFIEAAACDFINLHNGLFTVNMSFANEIELRLEAPEFTNSFSFDNASLFLPVQFTFGIVTFILSN